MICPNCKSNQPEGIQICPLCNASMVVPVNQESNISSWMAPAIVALALNILGICAASFFSLCSLGAVFIGLILGIVAVCFASKVGKCIAAGDLTGAKSASSTVKICTIISFCFAVLWMLGVLFSILFVGLLVL